jgi:hypothetical protein
MRSVAYVAARADLLFAAGALLAAMLAWGAARARSVPRIVLAAVVAAMALAATPWGAGAARTAETVSHDGAGPGDGGPRDAPVFLAVARGENRCRVMVGTLASLTQLSLSHWTDPAALWRDAAERTPGAWDAHLGYADALREASAVRAGHTRVRDDAAVASRAERRAPRTGVVRRAR